MGLFSKGGFFDKLGRSIHENAKTILNTGAAVVSGIPVVGPLIGTGLSAVSTLIPETQQQKMLSAVERDGVIKASEVEKTIALDNPNISPQELAIATQGIVEGLQKSAGTTVTAIKDDAVTTKIPMTTKLVGYFKQYWYLVIGAIVGLWYFLFKGKKGKKRRF